MAEPIRVFISYAFDPDHAANPDAVLALSNRLRASGFDCEIDQYQVSPPEGWPKWMDRQIEVADYILVICTETYIRRVTGKEQSDRGLGVRWESLLLYQTLYDLGSESNKIIPVLFNAGDKCHIPKPIRGQSHFLPIDDVGFGRLVQRLKDLPPAQKPPLGELLPMGKLLPSLPERSRDARFYEPLRSNLHRAPQEQNFVGRQALLDKVHALLASGPAAALSHSVAGEGGVGKTQIAVQYAIRHAGDYAGRWWVNASKDTAEKSLRELAIDIGCTITDQHGPPEIRRDISNALAADGPHLVILDNVDDRATLNGTQDQPRLLFFPETCRVLVTTRLDHLLPTDRTINVPVLEPAEAVELLRSRREDPGDTRHDEVLLTIAEELGRHTLAVKLAAALLADPLQTPTALLDELRRVEIGSPHHPFHGIDEGELGQYAMDVAKSLALMLPRLEGELWPSILGLCSLCAPEDIPVELILECLKAPDGEIDAVLSQLDRFSIIDITAGGEAGGGEGGATITIHRLMQSLVRHLMPDKARAAVSGALVGRLLKHLDGMTLYERWAEHDRFLPHADAVLARFGDSTPEAAVLTGRTAPGHQNRLRFVQAAERYERAEAMCRAALGDDHPALAVILSNHATLLHILGRDLDRAIAMLREAERIDQAAFGDDHPKVATVVNNIGGVLKAKGDLDGALACYREAERIDRAAFGDDHPNVATVVNNIGMVLQAKGDLDGALACYREVERIFRKALGDDHPNVATVVNNIGIVLQAKGDLDGALACYREAERIDRAAFGDDHPNVATDVNNIGGVLKAKGDVDGAREMQVRAFSICIRTLGPRAMNTLTGARNIHGLGVDPIALARQLTDDETAEELGKALGTGQ